MTPDEVRKEKERIAQWDKLTVHIQELSCSPKVVDGGNNWIKIDGLPWAVRSKYPEIIRKIELAVKDVLDDEVEHRDILREQL